MSSERGRRKELKRAGVIAAREARAMLADAMGMLDGELASTRRSRAIAETVARAIASLFRTELGEPEDVRDHLRDSESELGRVLDELHAPDAGPLLESAGALVARSLGILHPACAALDHDLSRLSEPTEHGPLTAPVPRSGDR